MGSRGSGLSRAPLARGTHCFRGWVRPALTAGGSSYTRQVVYTCNEDAYLTQAGGGGHFAHVINDSRPGSVWLEPESSSPRFLQDKRQRPPHARQFPRVTSRGHWRPTPAASAVLKGAELPDWATLQRHLLVLLPGGCARERWHVTHAGGGPCMDASLWVQPSTDDRQVCFGRF